MAKKRKLRSSEPQAAAAAEPSVAEQTAPVAEVPVEEQVETQMAVDVIIEEAALPQVKEDEETKEEEAQEGENQGQEGELVAELESNGGETVTDAQANGADENGGGEDDVEGEEFDEEPLEKLLEPFNKDQLVSILKKAVDKYPDLMESVRSVADEDPAHRKIFIHGLGWDTTVEILTSIFGKYGEIEDIKHVTDRVSGKSKGYAFVLFKHREGARRALKEPQKRVGNRTTSCQLASAGPVPAPPPNAPPVSEYTQRKIFVSNVSADFDPLKLLEFFNQFGEVEDGPLGLDKQTGKPKGFALFVYKSPEGARKALEEPHKNYEGITLHCQKAIDGPKQGKSSGGGHHQQQHHYSQPHYHHSRKEKNKYAGSSGGGGAPSHMMTPTGPPVGYNPAPPAQVLNPALGQALTAFLATQGAGMGIGNLMGGIGGQPMNQGGMPGGYVNQPGGGYGMQPVMPGTYQNPQMGQGGGVGRPPQGGGYMGH